jgi:cytochrome c oxidase subunit 3
VAHADAPALHPPTSTGIDSRKLAIWTFIGSECLFFASLISTYLVYKGKSLVGPLPHEVSQCLLHGKMQQCEPMTGNRKKLLTWLSLTVLGGLFFAAMQIYEFTHFYHKGLGYTTNLFSQTFYTLTGFHGSHVTLGAIWLGTLLIQAFRGKLTPDKAVNLEIAALYWHFVDVVWIVIFPVVYLMR